MTRSVHPEWSELLYAVTGVGAVPELRRARLHAESCPGRPSAWGEIATLLELLTEHRRLPLPRPVAFEGALRAVRERSEQPDRALVARDAARSR